MPSEYRLTTYLTTSYSLILRTTYTGISNGFAGFLEGTSYLFSQGPFFARPLSHPLRLVSRPVLLTFVLQDFPSLFLFFFSSSSYLSC